jgi:hypothetical protein
VAKLAANAKTPEDRTRVEQMQRYLDQAGAPGQPRPGPQVAGSLVEFVCLEQGFKVVVDTSQGKKAFLIPDPKQVAIVGRAGGKAELSCGPQAPTQVKIDYTPAAPGAEVDGILKVLYFE